VFDLAIELICTTPLRPKMRDWSCAGGTDPDAANIIAFQRRHSRV